MYAFRLSAVRRDRPPTAAFDALSRSGISLAQGRRSDVRRGYAVPINRNSSVDPLLGIAPPTAPTPQAGAKDAAEGKTDALPNFLAGTARTNNPNDLTELLRGNRFLNRNPGQDAQNTNRTAAAIGAMRRGAGSAIPTQDLENAFMPPEQVQPPEPTARAEVEVETPPQPVDREHPHTIDSIYGRNDLDERILAAARALHHARQQGHSPGSDATSLTTLMDAFRTNSERTLSIELPNESRPKDERRVPMTSAMSDEQELRQMSEDGVLLIAYVTGLDAGRGQERISVCSGFAVEGGDRLSGGEGHGQGALVVSCAHTLRGSIPRSSTGDPVSDDSSIGLAITRNGHVVPIRSLLSSLPTSDLILLQLGEQALIVDDTSSLGAPLRSSTAKIRTLPVNPYPAAVGTELGVSSFWGWEDDAGSTLPAFEFQAPAPAEPTSSRTDGSSSADGLITRFSPALTISPGPLPPPVGRERDTVKHERDDAGRSRWGRARLVEYRDGSGKEAKVGTYDDLAQLDFKLLRDNMHNPPALQQKAQTSFPPPGSSGGPIVDVSTGAVVGITRGTKMGILEGRRGDGIPAERIFFMFALPGFGKKQ